ncbi:MAG TPA: peptide ABC transporter substrate-binding protein [Gammaproteobacteria bacterium]
MRKSAAWWSLAAMMLGGCGQGGGPAASIGLIGGESGTELAAEQVIHIGNLADPQTLDPHRNQGVSEANIDRDLFEGLVNEAPNGDLIPGVAESWEISEDGKTYTFHLRADARWSNGDPVTAEDFVYSLRRSADPATLSRYSFVLAPIVNAEEITAGDVPPSELGVRALDAHTLEIRLDNATPYFLGLLAHSATYPVHRPTVEQFGDEFTNPGNLVSNGAYVLAEWVVQSHVKLVRNPLYWDNESTTIDEVYYYATENQAAELQRFRAGGLDMTYTIPKAQLPWIRENLADQLVIAPYLGTYYYGLNLTKPPFKDAPALRRALALAIDRDIITQQVTAAGEIPAYGWIPPNVANYESQQMPEAAWTQEERETEAKRLYAQAGYSAANPLRVELLYNTQDDHKRIAVAVAAMWKQVLGVETTLVNQEWKVYLDTRNQRKTQVFRAGWIGDYNDAYSFAEVQHSASGLNNTGYANPEYDHLLELASAEQDLAKRAEYLQEAERVLLDDMPLIPIYYYVTARMVKPWVRGYEANIMDHFHTKDLSILAH